MRKVPYSKSSSLDILQLMSLLLQWLKRYLMKKFFILRVTDVIFLYSWSKWQDILHLISLLLKWLIRYLTRKFFIPTVADVIFLEQLTSPENSLFFFVQLMKYLRWNLFVSESANMIFCNKFILDPLTLVMNLISIEYNVHMITKAMNAMIVLKCFF